MLVLFCRTTSQTVCYICSLGREGCGLKSEVAGLELHLTVTLRQT